MRHLLRAKLWMLKNALTHLTWGDGVKAAVLGLTGVLFLSGIYWGFHHFLAQLKDVPLIGGLLATKLMAMALLTTFFMMVISSALTSFGTMFFAPDISFLMLTPLSLRAVFTFKALETTLYASWMVMAALVPFFAAYGRVFQGGLTYYAALMVLSVPYAVVACAIGVAVTLALIVWFPSRRVKEIMLVLTVLAGCALYILFRWMGPEKMARADTFQTVVQYIGLLEAPLAGGLPSWWLTRAVSAATAGKTGVVFQNGLMLFGAAAAAVMLLTFFAQHAYHRGWTQTQESSRRKTGAPFGREWGWAPVFLGRKMGALLGKDALLFVRDPKQWTQLLVLASLVAVYLISVQRLPVDTPTLRWILSFLNIGLVGFVLSSVALRLHFPSVSLEGKSWWVLRGAPVSLWNIVGVKLAGALLPLVLSGVVLVGVSNHFLKVDEFVNRLSLVTVIAMAVTLGGMAVGFGALFPRFHEDDIARIEMSPGGFFYMVSSFFYIGLTLSIEAVLLREHYFGLWRRGVSLDMGTWVEAVLLLGALNALFFLLPLALGKKNLENAVV